MLKRTGINLIKLLFIILIVFVIGCGKKNDDKTNTNDTSKTNNTNLIKKDSVSGKEKVQLKYVVKKGDIFRYKVVAKTSTSENSPATEGKDLKQENEINYFYNKEVSDVDQNRIASYKVKFDSINITSKMADQNVMYNSNIND